MVRSATIKVHSTITCTLSRGYEVLQQRRRQRNVDSHKSPQRTASAVKSSTPIRHVSNTNSELYHCTNLLVQTMVVCKCPLAMNEDRALVSQLEDVAMHGIKA
jgi:hypothetical protein